MRNIDVKLSLELMKENYTEVFLVSLGLSIPVYYTDLDYPVYYGGNRYEPHGIKFPSLSFASAMSVDQATIEIADADSQVIAMLLSQDARSKTVVIYCGATLSNIPVAWDSGITWDTGIAWDTGNQMSNPVVTEVFRGILGEWEKSESKVTITVVNEFILWRKKPLRTASSTCPWVFKGTECAYAGAETWCDNSYDRCTALGNNISFGGDRFLPSLQGKKIWWGRAAS